MRLEDLIDEVAQRTSGTQGDPQTREEVAPIVQETVRILQERPGEVDLINIGEGEE